MKILWEQTENDNIKNVKNFKQCVWSHNSTALSWKYNVLAIIKEGLKTVEGSIIVRGYFVANWPVY